MHRSLSPAAKLTRAARLLAATVLFAPGIAAAQQADPFAIPDDLTIESARQADQQGPGLSGIVVDGQQLPRLAELRYVDGDLAISGESAVRAGLPVAEGATGFIKLKDIRLATWSFDKLAQRVDIKLMRNSDGPNDVNVARRNFAGQISKPLFAGMLNYTLFASVQDGKVAVAATVNPRVSYGNFSLEGTLTMVPHPQAGQERFVRTDTTATFVVPGKNLIARAGDILSAGSESQRALRLGGIQIGTDFDLRPDLVTTPMPEFAGSVAVPTNVDVLINDQRLVRSELEAGEFRIHDIPVATGRGEISIVLKDQFGRETVQTTKLYVSRSMLDKGLWQWAANLGWVRRRYGVASNDYQNLVGTFFVRRGLSKSLSAGISGEVNSDLLNLGAEVQATIGHIGMAFAEVRYSNTANQSGALFRGGFESVGRGISGRIEAIVPTRGYRDLASVIDNAPLQRQYVASIDFDLGRVSKINLSVARQEQVEYQPQNAARRRTDFVRLGLRRQLGARFSLSADASYRRSDRSEFVGTLGLTMLLGRRTNAGANVQYGQGRVSGNFAISRPDMMPGDFGYTLKGSAGEDYRIGGGVSYRANFARALVEAEAGRNGIGARAMVQGSLIFVDNQLFARATTGGAFALVRTGDVEGVTILRENRLAGVTGKRGKLLVSDLGALVPTSFNIDADKLPVDAVARATAHKITVLPGAVGLVDIDVERYRSQLMRVVDARGTPLPLNTRLTAQPSGREYFVGFDGIMDFNGFSTDKTLELAPESGFGCNITVPADFAKDPFAIPDFTVPCTALNIARAD